MYNIICCIMGLFLCVFPIGLCSAYGFYNNRQENKRKISEKFQQISNFQRDANEICCKLTNTSCEHAEDYIKLSELYAKEKAFQNGIIAEQFLTAERINKDDIKILDSYRRTFTDFYTNDMDYNNLPRYPSLAEFETYCTLHWTLAMTNNVMKKTLRPHYNIPVPRNKPNHELALTEIKRQCPSSSERVNRTQNEVKTEFHKHRTKFTGKKVMPEYHKTRIMKKTDEKN